MRIFVEPSALVEGELQIRGDEHHYLARVRRAAVGDRIGLLDGEGRQARAEILAISDSATTVKVYPILAVSPSRISVRVLLPPIKGDRMDVALEKLVEVGVDEIVVWPAARSIVKLDPDKRDARIAKYQLELQAAARQSGRAYVPTIAWADSLASAVANLDGVKLVLDPGSEAPLTEALDDLEGVTDRGEERQLTFASGPEGGLAPSELSQLLLAGFAPIGLGPRILRAETAPVAAVAIMRAFTRT